MPSCFSRVQLFATLWTVACQLLCSWDSPSKNTGVGCYAFFQGTFWTQGSSPHFLSLLCWQAGSLPLALAGFCCCCSVSKSTPWTAALQASLSFTISWSLLKLMPIESVIPSNHLSPSSPLALNLSQHQGLFQWVSSLHQVAKVLELQLQFFQWIFRIDFLWDWLVWSPCCPRDSQESSPVLQFEGINLALSLFMVQLSYPYKTTGKTIVMIIRTFVNKVMFLLFKINLTFGIILTS